MAGPAEPTFTRIRFRLKHNCPVSRLSADFPEATFLSWSSHRKEIVNVLTRNRDEERIREAFAKRLPAASLIAYEGGLLCVFKPTFPTKASISWQLEAHGALWLQPLRCVAGWEHFDVVSLDDAKLATYLNDLVRRFTVQVTHRGRMGSEEFRQSFFVPLNPVLHAMTARQWDAMRAAVEAGYYQQPRRVTTRDVAKRMGIGRSAFEERLRNAENALIRGVAASEGAKSP